MARIKGLIPPQSFRFADDYDVYVDYGKGRPVKMNDNEAIFIDVEKFLIGQSDQSNMINNKKPNGITRTNIANGNKSGIRNNCTHDSTTANEQSSPYKSTGHYSTFRQYDQENIHPQTHDKYHPIITPFRSYRNPSSSKFRVRSKINYDETWLSNKKYNTRVAAFIDHTHEKLNSKAEHISNERKSSRTCTYQASTGQIIHERIYPGKIERKLCLNIAVNGASKSMRGQLPLSNLSLDNGDFGDDAGMFIENREFSFVGLADGAGGNRSLGINPADFSQGILAACRDILHQNNLQSNQLSRLTLSATQQVQASEIRGSSTLCLLALDKQEHILTSLNIGDSGFVIYRNNKIYHRSTCTMNSDGCGPRQLFAFGDSFGLPCFINENEILQDCSVDNVKVQKNDIIILSSDGLWDVIKADQLQKIMERNANNHLQELADDLFNQAVDGYIVNNRDDILIIVCRVNEL